MGQDRLSDLALSCIHHAYADRVEIKKVIDEFPLRKGFCKFFF